MRPVTEKKIKKMARMYAQRPDCKLCEVAAVFGHDPAIVTRWAKTEAWIQVMREHGFTTAKKTKPLRLSLEVLRASKRCIEANDGNVSKAARSLGISQQSLWYRTRLGIWESL